MKSLLAFLLSTSLAFAQLGPGTGVPIGPGGGGSGGGGAGSGTVTSIATGCQAAGGTITTTGTISTQLQTGATIIASQQDSAAWCGQQIIGNAASGQTLTLQNTTASNYFRFINKGAGTWTLSAGTGAINSGCSSVAQNQSADIQFDGTNWNIACGVGGGGSSTITAGATATSGVTSGNVIGSASNLIVDTAIAYANIPLLNGNNTFSASGAASTPGMLFTGAPFTGGTGTTTFPYVLIQPTAATASTTWSTTGTAFGINAHTGIGNLMELQLDGFSTFKINSGGSVTTAGSVTIAAANFFSFTGRGILTSRAGGNIQFGNADVAAPVAQTITAQSVVAGNTNTAGATFTIAGSRSNGSGGGDLLMQTTLNSAASGSQNALATALTLKGGTQNVVIANTVQHTLIYSAAGTPLPTCNGGAEGTRAAVSDALAPAFLTAYVSGGTVHASVYCDGTSWKTD